MENGIKREVYLGTKKKKKTQLSHTQSFHDIHYPQTEEFTYTRTSKPLQYGMVIGLQVKIQYGCLHPVLERLRVSPGSIPDSRSLLNVSLGGSR